MARETLEQVNQKTGFGNILISAYKYLRDQNFLLGTYKNPTIVERKQRIAHTHSTKLKLSSNPVNKPIFSYKNNTTDTEVRIMTFNVAVKSNKPVSFDIYKNPTLTAASWVNFNTTDHILKDISATAYTGGELVGGVDVPEAGGVYISLGDLPVFFTCEPNEIISIVCTTDQSSDLFLRIRLEEI